MKKLVVLLAIMAIVGLMGVTNVWALDFGINSTIQDFVAGTAFPGAPASQGNEDNETEPGTLKGQGWDLEGGFFDNGSVITMVGGFDFMNGQLHSGHTYTSGDIFIDINGDSVPNSSGDQGNFGFEYALSFHDSKTITLYDLSGASESDFLQTSDIHWSSPWRVDANKVQGKDTGVGFNFMSGLTGADVGFAGYNGNDSHYALQLDLDAIFGAAGLGSWSATRGTNNPIFQFTMECGNDQLRFRDPVPEPATLLLLGAGLIGLFTFGRKQLKK